MVLYEYAVQNNSDIGMIQEGTVFLEYGSGVDDVIDIPFAGFPHRVGHWRRLLVYSTDISVDVSLVLVIVQNLHLVPVLEEYATVAAPLAAPGDALRDTPLQMELEAAERLSGDNITFALVYSDNAVMDSPAGVTAFAVGPLAQVFPVEKDNGVRWGCVGQDVTGSDDLRLRRPVFGHFRAHGLLFRIGFLLLCKKGRECP